MSDSGGFDSHPHVALIPSAGMGHLTPFLRLAASLVQHHCRVTLITTYPTVSLAETQHVSHFLSASPQVTEKRFHLLPFDPNSANATDPFLLRWEAIRRSAHLLAPLLSPPLSALITDVTLISAVLPVTINLHLPNYVLFTASAKMFSLTASFPAIVASKSTSSGSVEFDDDFIEIPGLPPIPLSSVPPAVMDSKSLFATSFLENGNSFVKSNGVLINSFDALEADTLVALNGRRVVAGLPPVYAVGPLLPCEFEKRDDPSTSLILKWLDDQPEGSVVYVSFGSRLALSMEQTKELGDGLLSSGCRFLWVVKGKIVDKEDEESLKNVLGHELTEKIKDQGLVVKNWVDQDKVLSHRAVGGFVSHGNINKPEKVQLVELRRAYNCEIMLTKIKIPLPDMMNAVLALDSSALDIDQVENLIKFCPTKEEMELLKNYAGDKVMLGKCEQFFLELMKVPRVESKLRVFAFRISFSMQVDDLRHNLNTINDATREVKESVKLRQIMQTILTLGNALNQGTARGSAVGFKLDSLLKLSDTRARNNKMTLMHYLCKLLAEKMPELLDFDKGLVHLEAASKIQLKALAEEMQAVSKGLEKVEQELTASENDGAISLGFQKALKNFLDTAEAEVRSLISLYSEVGRNADSLSQYFGEDPARCPFEQVTQILVVFVKLFKKSREENERQADAEKKKLEKDAMKERAAANSSAKIDIVKSQLNFQIQK